MGRIAITLLTPDDPEQTDSVDGGESNIEWIKSPRKKRLQHRVSQYSIEHWGDLLRLSNSILPDVFVPSLVLTAWAALVSVFYLVPHVCFLKTWGLPNSILLITILGSAMSLLLVFRVNTAYDRYYEGRKLWNTVHFQIRNLARFIWIYSPSISEEDIFRKTSAMHLLVGFASSTKHALRNEPSHLYDDLGPYIRQIPQFSPKIRRVVGGLPIPLEIAIQLQRFLNKYCTAGYPASASVSALVDALSSFHRIKASPIPDAFRIHLKQTVVVYIISLPFQLVASPLQWFTIPFVFFSSMIMLGIERIGAKIENPFNYDVNDLPQDEFCDAIAAEIKQIIDSEDANADSKGWITPCSLEIQFVELENLKKLTIAAILAHKENTALTAVTSETHGFSFDMFVSVQGMVAKLVGPMDRIFIQEPKQAQNIHRNMPRSGIPSIVIDSQEWITSSSAEATSLYSKHNSEVANDPSFLSSNLAPHKRSSLWEIAGSLWEIASSLWENSPRKKQMQHKVKQYKDYGLPNSILLVTFMGTIMSLLLVFRVNTAYDRFWEGSKLWSSIIFQLRNLARYFWICSPSQTPEDWVRKTNAMNLLIAYASAVKHSLRDEPSHKYSDLGPYLEHISKYSANSPRIAGGLAIPLEIMLYFQEFVDKECQIVWLLASQSLLALEDSVGSAHRIKDSPIPAAYRIFLKHMLVLYLLSLPFQLVASPLQWFTIPFVFFVAMMTLGIEVIGVWIENPFGYDASDLPQDEFCDSIAAEITQIMHSQDRDGKHSRQWTTPCSLEIQRVDLTQLCEVTRTSMAVRRRSSPTGTLTNNDTDLVPVQGMAAKLVGLRPVPSQPTVVI
ncbi:hypothetical protein HK100_002522 [Physocladia obscura]|uniref:Uncharacterized protein n=1 Tax=Physocladia obscura TaxID=109957 RepID=A0AAD5XJZ5_9FUNG|nr:hypothetical protein HK100_002522 [Physocladia obscura]